jgi:hypothetical protein
MPTVEPTVPTVIGPELTRLNPLEPTPATEPEIEFVGSVKVTEPLGALADKEAAEIAAGTDPPTACVMFPFAAFSIRVPAEALIGALMKML